VAEHLPDQEAEMVMDEQPCGEQFEIEAVDIVAGRREREVTGTVLVCSKSWGHVPSWTHSDGITDWIGDEPRD